MASGARRSLTVVSGQRLLGDWILKIEFASQIKSRNMCGTTYATHLDARRIASYFSADDASQERGADWVAC
jgi:hypothetical protein